jgi:hypothetical protein
MVSTVQKVSVRGVRKSLFTSTTLLKSLSGDAEVADTARYCLVMRGEGTLVGDASHHIRGSVSIFFQVSLFF